MYFEQIFNSSDYGEFKRLSCRIHAFGLIAKAGRIAANSDKHSHLGVGPSKTIP
jgi:hypothetical protein